MAAKISIFLARRVGADDEISITPIMDDFKIVYYDGFAKSTHFVYASESEVIAYVDDLFNLLIDDVIDPFKSIQFTFPCFPSVLYKVPDFSNEANRYAIKDRLISTLRNWPESLRSLGILNRGQNNAPLNAINPNAVNPPTPLFNPSPFDVNNFLPPLATDRTSVRADAPSENVMRFPDIDFII
jgi:hypothetical protein